MDSWRLILDGPGSGEWNMAVDQALLESRAAGGMPTLRLYRWKAPTVSVGRFQRIDDVDLALCAERGIDVVRRPTGGRGVLHDDEVTYSVTMSAADGLPRGTAASYRVLSGALAEAYRRLGIDAELTLRPRGEPATGACYLHTTPADLSLGAAKLSGSAQVWLGDACLQHGSIVISRDTALEAAVFRLDARSAERLRHETATLASTLGNRPSVHDVVEALKAAFSSTFGVSYDGRASELSVQELDLARRILRDGRSGRDG